MMILLGKIRNDGGTQARGRLDVSVMDDYAELLKDPDFNFPDAVVFDDGECYWLADGFHRYGAYSASGRVEMPCEVRQGTRRDALMYALSANAKQGMRRTAEDRRHAVLMALKDEEWGHWSDNEIARLCAVSPHTVARTRSSLCQTHSDAAAEPAGGTTRTYRARSGKTAAMRTKNIGRKKEAPAAREAPPDTSRAAEGDAKPRSQPRPNGAEPSEEAGQGAGEIKPIGVGVVRAHEALNSLTRIPKNDPQRKRGFQIVKDWIRSNESSAHGDEAGAKKRGAAGRRDKGTHKTTDDEIEEVTGDLAEMKNRLESMGQLKSLVGKWGHEKDGHSATN